MPSEFDAANRTAFGDPEVARIYATSITSLFAGEKRAIEKVSSIARGRPILDIGVGAGRTTPALLELSRDYIGVDYSPSMVAAARESFPGVRFEIGDARNLGQFPSKHFGLVMFSFNGIDCVNLTERVTILHEVNRVLADDGVFIFSSHDFRYDPRQTQPAVTRVLGRVKDCLGNLAAPKHLQSRALANGIECRPNLAFGGKHILLLCYISSEAQAAQLGATGFSCKTVFNTAGEKISPGTVERVAGPWLYYVVQKT